MTADADEPSVDDDAFPDGGGTATLDGAQFAGPGFGTVSTRLPWAEAAAEAPAVVSRRAVLRDGLPAVYQDSDFAMRFVRALEEVLDPVGAVLDGLHHYVDPGLAPRAALELICAWLGVETSESQTIDELRDLARHAAELGRTRGTARGLQLALRLSFPGMPLRVEGGGAVRWPGSPEASTATEFIVYCDTPIPPDQQVAVARAIERERPVGAAYRLRVKSAKKKKP